MTFDDERLVEHAGLFLASTLGERLGLGALFTQHLRLERHGANVADKARTVVHGLLAGADCIDDVELARAGARARSSVTDPSPPRRSGASRGPSAGAMSTCSTP